MIGGIFLILFVIVTFIMGDWWVNLRQRLDHYNPVKRKGDKDA